MRLSIIRRYRTLAVALLSIVLLGACQTATTTTKMFTIGVVRYTPALDLIFDGFKEGMTRLGYIENQNVIYFVSTPAGTADKLDPIINEFKDKKVDLIFSLGTPASQAAKRLTEGTNQRVLFQAFDPVLSGIVTSLSHPGGNMTGIQHGLSEAKRVEWFTKVVPNAKRFFVMYNPADKSASLSVDQIKSAATALGIQLIIRETKTVGEVLTAVANIPSDADAIYMPADGLVAGQMATLVSTAYARKLPLAVVVESNVVNGALFSYGFEYRTEGVQFSRLADQIFKNVAPGDIPIETAEFFLTVNLDTAQKIGLTLSDDLLRRANRIIRPGEVQQLPTLTFSTQPALTPAATPLPVERTFF